MLVMNASSEDQPIRVFGNHFVLKSGQIKEFQEEIGRFMVLERGYLGLVGVPEEFSDIEFRQSEEGQAKLQELKAEGIAKRVRFLNQLVHNEIVSLKRDLDKVNSKEDPRLLMDPKMVKQMRELASYQAADEDVEKAKVAEIKRLEERLKKNLTPSDKAEILKGN